MNELTKMKETMTSLEMANTLKMRHDNVKRGILRLVEELEWDIISEGALDVPSDGGDVIVEKQILMPGSGMISNYE